MPGKGGQKFSHGYLSGVRHLNQLLELLPRFAGIDGFRGEAQALGDGCRGATHIESSAAVEQHHISRRPFIALQHAPDDGRARFRVATA